MQMGCFFPPLNKAVTHFSTSPTALALCVARKQSRNNIIQEHCFPPGIFATRSCVCSHLMVVVLWPSIRRQLTLHIITYIKNSICHYLMARLNFMIFEAC